MRNAVVTLALLLALAGCGEPPVDVDIPARADGQQVLDLAGILSGSDVDNDWPGAFGTAIDALAEAPR
ncbi:MAG: hypothetical protein ACRDU8_02035 [Egibacteraceae bacterium]